MKEDSPLKFPCPFPITAVGKAGEDFEHLVFEIIRHHLPDLDVSAMRCRESRGGRWVAVTITIQAQSREQLDAIYRELSGHERVRWAL